MMTTKLLKHTFDSTKALCESYMPFITHAALFIPSREAFEMGEAVTVDIQLMDEPDRIEYKGAVVWITPLGAQGGKPQGIGVQFNEDDSAALRNRIETYLAGMLNSPLPTHTM